MKKKILISLEEEDVKKLEKLIQWAGEETDHLWNRSMLITRYIRHCYKGFEKTHKQKEQN